jgi:hypothetical protein
MSICAVSLISQDRWNPKPGGEIPNSPELPYPEKHKISSNLLTNFMQIYWLLHFDGNYVAAGFACFAIVHRNFLIGPITGESICSEYQNMAAVFDVKLPSFGLNRKAEVRLLGVRAIDRYQFPLYETYGSLYMWR